MFGRRNTNKADNVVSLSGKRAGLSPKPRTDAVGAAVARARDLVRERIPAKDIVEQHRHELVRRIAGILDELAEAGEPALHPHEKRDAVTDLLNERLLEEAAPSAKAAAEPEAPEPEPAPVVEPLPQPAAEPTEEAMPVPARPKNPVEAAKERIQPLLMQHIDVGKASDLPRDELASQVGDVVSDILGEEKLHLNLIEQRDLVTLLLNDMLGLGPLEPLLADETITDIMVNGPDQVYVERRGKLELTGIRFRDGAHLNNVCSRIVSYVGRRVDESVPLVDCRLPDGSRVNIIIPPLAIDGATISIRKFAKKKITLDAMEKNGNLSSEMAQVLRIAGRARLNIVISGGTGSGKTTLLNALSRMIDDGERIVTIEDAAELQLQQPHVVRLETRPPNLEGEGEITQRELVKNALRMRPDRVILGEIRSGEALDMLQAMNTGHDGSMCTLHANRPREALTRLENMVAMAGVKLPNEAVRAQIAGAVNMIVQIARMRDGVRRITHVTEVVGMEGEVVTTQDLFTFEFEGEDEDGKLTGCFKSTGLRPAFLPRAQYFGLDRALMDAMG